MSLSRRNPKRDANEAGIVAGLEERGYEVTRVSGAGAPDVLARKPGDSWAVCMEIKNIKGRGRRTTTAQKKTQWPIVLTIDDALTLLAGSPQAGTQARDEGRT